jgi:hypothetical protein
MSCQGNVGDYLCPGWITRTAKIRARDGNRCRGCDRIADEIRLEVHHRRYGIAGPCGQCYLTAVADEDLTTLCIDCHDGITDVRRRVRYGTNPVVALQIPDPEAMRVIIKLRTVIVADVVEPSQKRLAVTRRSAIDRLGKE